MVRTPRLRGGSKEPTVIELGAGEVRRVDDAVPVPAEAGFAASESLTPGESAATPDMREDWTRAEQTLLDDHGAATAGIVTPEAAQSADSFRFAESLPAPAPDEAPVRLAAEDGAVPAGEAEPPEPLAADGPPAPVFSELPPETAERLADEPQPAAGVPPAEPPPARRRGFGGLLAAGLLGGILALLLAGLLQFGGYLPGLNARNDEAAGAEAMRAELDGLKAEVAALREQAGVPPQASGPDPSVTAALDALGAEVAQLKGAAGSGDLAARLGAVEAKVEMLSGNAVSADVIAALGERASAAETLGRVNSTGVADAARRLAALEQTLSGMSATVEALGRQPKVALALAASALREASDRGAPFEAELATLAALAPDLAEAKALQPYAASGVPTRDALQADWAAAAGAMLATENPADPDAGFMSRLFTSAGGLVSVRPIGAVEGTGVSAVVARMEVALNGGDLQKLVSEYDALPDAARQAGAAFAGKARARLAVESLIDGAIASAMKAA